MRPLVRLLFVGVLLAAGCSGKKPRQATPYNEPGGIVGTSDAQADSTRRLIVTPASGASGKVAMVNTGSRFVVLTFPLGHLPANSRHLNVYRRGLKVGEIRITGPQYDDNVVADLLAGECEIGDEARE